MIRLSTHRGVILRFFMNGLRLGLAAAVFLPGIVAAVNANAQGVAAIVIRMDDRSLPAGSASLPAGMQQALASALGVTSTMGERTRDGAFTLDLSTPLAVDATRAALNRIRSMPGVLYANEAPGAPAPATTGRPTDRLIVKYRDASPSSTTRAGTPLAAARIERISALAGVPVAWMRAGHDGYDVLRMLQRLPIARVEAIAATIAQDADVEYAQPDYIRTRQVVPTDPCYASARRRRLQQWLPVGPVRPGRRHQHAGCVEHHHGFGRHQCRGDRHRRTVQPSRPRRTVRRRLRHDRRLRGRQRRPADALHLVGTGAGVHQP